MNFNLDDENNFDWKVVNENQDNQEIQKEFIEYLAENHDRLLH